MHMALFPMFPLGTVLFPYMPLPLRVFEDRYLRMLADILAEEPSEFGVALIERGQEVGGGETGFSIGTVAQITQLEAADGFVALLAEGDRRIEVIEWGEDDPYPRALVRELPPLEWRDELMPLREETERIVRRALAVASEYSDQAWSATIEVAQDPVAAAWQLTAIAPLGELDQLALLGSASMEGLLGSLSLLTLAAEDTFRAN